LNGLPHLEQQKDFVSRSLCLELVNLKKIDQSVKDDGTKKLIVVWDDKSRKVVPNKTSNNRIVIISACTTDIIATSSSVASREGNDTSIISGVGATVFVYSSAFVVLVLI
jgi:hypothetical protein